MAKRKEAAGKSGRDVDAGNDARVEGQNDAAKRRLHEVQLARLGATLRDIGNTREVARALGDDPDQYASRLAKQYSDLARKLQEPSPLQAPALPFRLAANLDKLSDIFLWWQSVTAPNATVGLVQTPGSHDTDGQIGAEIFRGSLSLLGEISNSGTQEQWWVNTWQYIVPFPTIPSGSANPGSLSYRFNVGASAAFYRQDIVTGSVHAYVTVAATNDLSHRPLDFNHPVSSDFAIAGTLPTPAVPPIVSGSVKASGTIQLVPGGTPAIGIIIGLIFSIAQGDLQIVPGEYSVIILAPPDATSPTDIGKVEYRRDQPFWVDAVAKMLAP